MRRRHERRQRVTIALLALPLGMVGVWAGQRLLDAAALIEREWYDAWMSGGDAGAGRAIGVAFCAAAAWLVCALALLVAAAFGTPADDGTER